MSRQRISHFPEKISARKAPRWLLAAMMSLSLSAAHDHAALAAEITVNDQCTLIDAITSANADHKNKNCAVSGQGTDTLILEPGSTYTFTQSMESTDGANALPAITSSIVIQGNGATLSRQSLSAEEFRFFQVTETGQLTLNNIVLSGGYASGDDYGSSGGAILNRGELIINNTTIAHNSAINGGGGIRNLSSGTVTLINSTLSNNGADLGGGILNTGIVVVANSTLSGNSAIYGGALVNFSGSASLHNCTLAGNRAIHGGGIYNESSSITLGNSIIANSIIGKDCDNLYTTVTTAGNNWFEDARCDGRAYGDPRLGPLEDNGGATRTHRLLPGSGAIDAGDDLACAEDPVNNLDQRGVTRPQGERCDIGALEQEGGHKYYPGDLFIIPLGNGKTTVFSL